MGQMEKTEALVPVPVATPLYRMDRSFEENAQAGPDFNGPYPAVPVTPPKEFFGHPVASRVGIAASLVLNSGWARTFSRLGFDILTYKTVRSSKRLAHSPPNWLYPDPGMIDAGGKPLKLASGQIAEPQAATAVGSFGMPSIAPEIWRQDIRATRNSLPEGQVLIVSVVGTALDGIGRTEFVEDFAWLAENVVDAGAHVVELNLSCPNVDPSEGEIYLDPALSAEIAEAARKRVGRDIPILVKIGAVEDDAYMAKLLVQLAPHVDGIVMINAPGRELLDETGRPAFGEARKMAGMMGGITFDIGLACVRRAVAAVRRHDLGLRIIAVGGVTSPRRIAAYFDAGAYAVLGASALAWDPFLAIRTKHLHPEF
jgi:dihydroorotate dehydrogenase